MKSRRISSDHLREMLRTRISNAAELISAALSQGIVLDAGEADMILGYLEGHDYCLMVDGKGGTARHDEQYGDNHRGDEPYTVVL